MSKELYDNAVEFREEFLKRLKYLTEALPIIIPQSKEDAQQLRVGMDMLGMIGDELSKAETLGDFGRVLDLEELEEGWEDAKQNILDVHKFGAEKEVTRVGSILSGE